MISKLFIAAMTITLAACFHGKLPPQEFYRLRTPVLPESLATLDHDGGSGGRLVGGIAIVPYVAPGLYGDRGIVFRIGDNEYGAYPNREWAVPVPTMLGLITEDVFGAHPLTTEGAVFDPPSPNSYPYVWRGLVRELEEVDRGRRVYASVRLDARIVRTKDDSIVWSGSARRERPVPSGTMPAIIETLSRLSAEVILQLQESARVSLAESAASAVRQTPRRSSARP
ncbi:MAG TPA: hypothetical protein VH539_05725 [Gemmatimonadaceae bacterium]